ncbi:hypothetical protein F5Y14DRAFT_350280 [Nemania sp. NC0429]|nr:hypothetical protein F5Y14DRAFT_350280 [Nemania sp. NC0429]
MYCPKGRWCVFISGTYLPILYGLLPTSLRQSAKATVCIHVRTAPSDPYYPLIFFTFYLLHAGNPTIKALRRTLCRDCWSVGTGNAQSRWCVSDLNLFYLEVAVFVARAFFAA